MAQYSNPPWLKLTAQSLWRAEQRLESTPEGPARNLLLRQIHMLKTQLSIERNAQRPRQPGRFGR